MAVAQITAVIEVQFLVWELPHASGTAIKKKKKEKKCKVKTNSHFHFMEDYFVVIATTLHSLEVLSQ